MRFQQRLAENYAQLSPRLREAGDYIVANPVDTATRSLRSVAGDSRIAPASFSRLARALQYDGFEELREAMRSQIGQQVSSFAGRAEGLRKNRDETSQEFVVRAGDECLGHLQNFVANLSAEQLEETADRLHAARKVVIIGALGSTGIAEYAGYMANFLGPNWVLAGRMGASIGSALCGLDARDALLVVTKPPYARASIRAAELARSLGAYVVVITDGHACPALRDAQSGFIVPGDSPNFFTSYVGTVFLIEALIAMIARKSGPETTARIAEIERHNRALDEVIGS